MFWHVKDLYVLTKYSFEAKIPTSKNKGQRGTQILAHCFIYTHLLLYKILAKSKKVASINSFVIKTSWTHSSFLAVQREMTPVIDFK